MESASAFAQQLQAWHDFYVLAGTAAATLMGLLFVALSLHLEAVVGEDGKHFNALAIEAFFSFIFTLILSLIMLIPSLVSRQLGVCLAMAGVFRMVRSRSNLAVVFRRRRGEGRQQLSRWTFVFRLVMPFVASLLLILAGWAFLQRDPETGFSLMVGAIMALLSSATGSAWDLLIRVGRERVHRGRVTG